MRPFVSHLLLLSSCDLWGVTEDNASSHDRVKSTFLSHYRLAHPVAFIITLISTEAWLSFSRNYDSVFILLWRKAILLGTAKEENESQEKSTSQSFGNERSINCQLTDIGKRYFPNITFDFPLECASGFTKTFKSTGQVPKVMHQERPVFLV